jgi:regulator of cell morphogenesis and NO signaling
MALDTTQSVREIVQQHPAAVPVFEAHGIDYCCGGSKSLEDACNKKNVPLNQILSELADALVARPGKEDGQWMTSPLRDLTAHVVERHHACAKRELPRLAALAAKVHLRHGHMYPELNQVRELVETMSSEMFTHMLKEEQVLFPRIATMEHAAENGSALEPAFFGALINPIRHMMSDHDDTGEMFSSIRNLTHDYKLPEDACMSYQALYQGLMDFEKDTHRHIHLENNILFPRALALEKAPSGASKQHSMA